MYELRYTCGLITSCTRRSEAPSASATTEKVLPPTAADNKRDDWAYWSNGIDDRLL